MKLMITGGGGFVGARLARTLLARGTLAGQRIDRLVLADIAPPPPDLLADARVEARTGTLLSQTDALRTEAFDGVFHLASAVSGECEADFELGLRSNLDSTRALLDALRANANAGGKPTRLVFSSSVAVFGPDPAVPLPKLVADDTLPAAADLVRHAEAGLRAPAGRLHAQGLHRRPCGAADDRDGASGPPQRRCLVVLQRHHPRAAGGRRIGLPGVARCVAPDVVAHAHRRWPDRRLRSLARAVPGRDGDEPAGAQRARERHAGRARTGGRPAVRKLVRFERDERIAGIVANWPGGASAARAARLGLKPHENFAEIIQQYIDDCRALPTRRKP
jgi:hypothetical protein